MADEAFEIVSICKGKRETEENMSVGGLALFAVGKYNCLYKMFWLENEIAIFLCFFFFFNFNPTVQYYQLVKLASGNTTEPRVLKH